MFPKGTATFTQGSKTVSSISMSAGDISAVARGSRLDLGTLSPPANIIEAVDRDINANTITLRDNFNGTTGTYSFVITYTGDGFRDAAAAMRDSRESLVSFVDSADVNPNPDTYAQRDGNGNIKTGEPIADDDAVSKSYMQNKLQLTTQELISETTAVSAGTTLTTVGFYAAGDAGGAQWKATSTTGLTASQTPSDREARELVDGSGRLWLYVGDTASIESMGATTNAGDNAPYIKAANSGGNIKVTAGSGVFLSSSFSLNSNTELSGSLSTTIKSIDDNGGGWLLLNINGKENVKISGITFDGNTSGNTSFNSVNLIFNSSKIRFSECKFINCRGISTFASGGEDLGMFKCDFEDCGTYNLISGSNSDRKQAFACSGVKGAYAKDCTFKNIGLDCISFATNCTDVTASGNTIDTNYAGSIYISNVNKFKVFGNTVNNKTGGGNGIDCVNSTNGEVFGNHCFENGAAGILFSDCSNVECFGNECWNNYQSANSVHRGGITISSLAACDNINIHGNTCFDDQGEGSVTQRYSIGVYTSGGSYSRVRIDENNNFRGYNSAGVESLNDVFQNNDLGFCGYPIQANLADQAELRLFALDSAVSEFSVIQVNNDYYGKFYSRLGFDATKVLDTDDAFVITDTGTSQAVYNDNGVLKLKNRTGTTRSYLIQAQSFATA
jgi:hypothetical protein